MTLRMPHITREKDLEEIVGTNSSSSAGHDDPGLECVEYEIDEVGNRLDVKSHFLADAKETWTRVSTQSCHLLETGLIM